MFFFLHEVKLKHLKIFMIFAYFLHRLRVFCFVYVFENFLHQNQKNFFSSSSTTSIRKVRCIFFYFHISSLYKPTIWQLVHQPDFKNCKNYYWDFFSPIHLRWVMTINIWLNLNIFSDLQNVNVFFSLRFPISVCLKHFSLLFCSVRKRNQQFSIQFQTANPFQQIFFIKLFRFCDKLKIFHIRSSWCLQKGRKFNFT